MVIHGREITFKRTVLANCEIADLCPNGDIEKIDKVINTKYAESQRAAAAIMAALSKGAEMARKYEEPGYTMRPLTAEEAMLLDNDEFNSLFTEAWNVFTGDAEVTVEAEAPKVKNAEGDSE